MRWAGKDSRASLKHGIASLVTAIFPLTLILGFPERGLGLYLNLAAVLLITIEGSAFVLYSRVQAHSEEVQRHEEESRKLLNPSRYQW